MGRVLGFQAEHGATGGVEWAPLCWLICCISLSMFVNCVCECVCVCLQAGNTVAALQEVVHEHEAQEEGLREEFETVRAKVCVCVGVGV